MIAHEIDEFTIAADFVIVAIGQGQNPLFLHKIDGFTLDRSGNVIISENGKT